MNNFIKIIKKNKTNSPSIMMSKELDDTTNNQVKRNPSILLALDSVHRSLLMKNMQYEGDDHNPFMNKNRIEQFNKYSNDEEAIQYFGIEDKLLSTCVKLTDEKYQQNKNNDFQLNQIFIDFERGINKNNNITSELTNNLKLDEDISNYDASKFLRGALGDENDSHITMNQQNIQNKSFSPTTSSSSSSSAITDENSENAIGYDTVDFQKKQKYVQYEKIDEISTNQLKELSLNTTTTTISSNHNKSLNSSTSTISSPNNSNKHNTSTEYYRSFKEKLRSSFRKGKDYIKNERKRIADFFDERDKLNENCEQIRNKENDGNKYFGDLDQYKSGFNDREAEKLYQKISTKFHEKAVNEINYEDNDQYLLSLINQISYQRSIRTQLSNAVNICRNTIEFESSPELIEAERLLLLSNLKESAAKRELIKYDYSNDEKKKEICINNRKRKGLILLNHFEFHLNDVTINDTLFNYFYICICSCNEQVLSTIAKERNGNKVIFNNCGIHFNELEPNYDIRVEVFVLRLRKNTRNYSHESKYHLNREPRSFLSSCPSTPRMTPGKFFNSSSATLPKKFIFDAEFSQFKTQGFTELTSFSLTSDTRNLSNYYRQIIKKHENYLNFSVEDLKEFKLSGVAYNSNLLGKILINIKSEIFMENNEINGFLNVGEEINGFTNWNHRWCRLDGITMYFWNYPQPNSDEKPIFTIDLTKCISDSIQLVDRTKCAKPLTFSIEIFGRNNDPNQMFNNNSKLYFLSADNKIELNQWMSELNNKTTFLKDWNI